MVVGLLIRQSCVKGFRKKMYQKPKQITGYWLFVIDASREFGISHEEAHAIASLIWPGSPVQAAYRGGCEKGAPEDEWSIPDDASRVADGRS